MKKLIIEGNPGIRRDSVISYGDEEAIHCFSVARQGEWHGPERMQLWCTVGYEDEYEDFMKRNYIPHFLDVDRIDAEAVEVVEKKKRLSI